MSKTIKRLVFIAAVIFICGVIQLIAPQKVNGFSITNGTTIQGGETGSYDNVEKTLEELKSGEFIRVKGEYILRTPYVFCYHEGQELNSTIDYSDYKITAKFEIGEGKVTRTKYSVGSYSSKGHSVLSTNTTTDASIVKDANGLAYILSNIGSKRFDDADKREDNDPLQRALWKYLEMASAKTKEFFSIPDQGNTDGMDNDFYKKAKNNTKNNTAIIYILDNGNDQQELLLVEKAEEQKIPEVKLSLKKTDINGDGLSGATISISIGENVSSVSTTSLTSTSNGNFGTITVQPTINTGTFKINLKETTIPSGYKGVPGTVTLTVTYNQTTGDVIKITSSNTEYVTSSGANITIKNKPKVNLTINKTDSLTGTKLSGAKFKLELTNVEDIENYQVPTTDATQSLPRIVYVTTDSNGQIKLTGILPSNCSQSIKVKITEVEVPTANGYYYKIIGDPIEIEFKYNNKKWIKVSGNIEINNNTITIGIQNTPLIDLSGMVWQDGQIGEKDVQGPNGNKDNGENGLSGVVVGLKRVSDGKIIETVMTLENGAYEFLSVPMTNQGYQIVFSYDGINWQETKSIRKATGGDSDASETESDRTAFNNRFKTINVGQSNDGTTLGYTYNNGVSALNVTMDGHTTGTTDAKFQMEAQTTTYTTTTENIDCGLVKKEVDLAVGTDVKSAKLEINEKSTEYSYAQIMNGEMKDLSLDDILQNNSSSNEDVTYNLYLYASDYNYRIADYKTNNDAISNPVNPSDNTVNNYEDLKELEAYVTYSVILKNQSTYDSVVDQFVYYYDEIYTPYNIVSTDKYDVKIDETTRKITFTSKNDGFKVTAPDYRAEIDITFTVNKDANGNIIIKDNVTNIAEITKYSTIEGGLIDKDSAPENANVAFANGTPTVGQYEDDTDEAKGINISVRKNETRTITGTVFEDLDKEGTLNNEDGAVNDVIVQLIEIKKINGNYYEYIWQQTRSGSNQVETTARNGYQGKTYTNNVQAESGQYEFKDYIPGNYIIRFIYGDGSTYDLTDNVKTYNGQDYKSTVDVNYQAAWYNTAGYTAGQSVARDNEARRLEVMAYSTTIDEANGEALERRDKEDLENTWMAAETSKINVPVDGEVSFVDMNFGLALRPETKLVLEKHITGLKITPSGTGVQPIVDAKANIENIVNGETVEISGVTDGLATIYSDRENRGFWQVATDVEELAQGAGLEVEYTYVIRNDGEDDYLSKDVLSEYHNNLGNDVDNNEKDDYVDYLLGAASSAKTSTKGRTESYNTYLGEFYYTGQKGVNDELVSSRIDAFEEALNNDLTFDSTEGIDFNKKEIAKEEANKTVYDTDGNPKTEMIDTIVENSKATTFLTAGTKDYSRTITLRTTLAASSEGELGANLPSYIAEITQYSNAAGRRDMKSEPANLSYVHSDDTEMTLTNSWLYELDGKTYEIQNKEEIPEGATNIREANEEDEFWAETIIITKPTGEDKFTPMQIAIITISAVAVLGVGIVLIKKFVLKK